MHPVQAIPIARPVPRRLPYQPGVDGIRALAIAAVLVYHAAPGALPGGFLGVDVFFVLSGYLITALLLAEWSNRGTLDLATFWRRRVRRLAPALGLVLLATLTWTAAFLPDQLASLRGDLLAALGYVANWHLLVDQRPYFETAGRPPLLQHLWSLAVEEQFYLVWPPLLLLGLRCWSRRGLLAALLFGALAASAWMAVLVQAGADPSRAYYGTDSRAGGLLLGAALAVFWSSSVRRRIPTAVVHLVGTASFSVLVLAGFALNESAAGLYRGGFAAVDLATTGLVATVVHPRARLVARLLGLPPLRWLGERSYSLYLWHWPILNVTRPSLDLPFDGWPALLLRLAIVAGVAELSYRFVERPIRNGALGKLWHTWRVDRGPRRRALAVPGVALAAGLVSYTALVAPALASARPPEQPGYLSVTTLDTWQAAEPRSTVPTVEPGGAAPTPADPTPAPADDTAPPSSVIDVAPAANTVPAAPTAEATPTAVPGPAPAAPVAPLGRIAAIGDSVMLGAATALQRTFDEIQVDAAVGRQVQAGLQILRGKRAAGALPDILIVHLGNNGTFTDDQADALLDVCADVRRVVFVNLRVPRSWEAPNNAIIASAVQRSSNAVLVDWHAASAGRPELFWDDGMHLRPDGAEVYAALIQAAIQ